jgi:hypothetical protein
LSAAACTIPVRGLLARGCAGRGLRLPAATLAPGNGGLAVLGGTGGSLVVALALGVSFLAAFGIRVGIGFALAVRFVAALRVAVLGVRLVLGLVLGLTLRVRVALGLRRLGLLGVFLVAGAFVLGLVAVVLGGLGLLIAVAVRVRVLLVPRRLLIPAARLGLALLADAGDHLADREGVALLGHDLDEDAVGVGVVGHVGLVRLDLHERLAALDLAALLDQPLQDRALFHRVRQAGHRHVAGHAPPYTSRKVASAACTTCSGCGNAACSSGFE